MYFYCLSRLLTFIIVLVQAFKEKVQRLQELFRLPENEAIELLKVGFLVNSVQGGSKLL